MVGYILGFWWVVACIQNFLFLFLSLPHFFSFLCLSLFFCILPSKSSSDQSDSFGEGCRADWTQNGHGGLHLLHLFARDGVLTTTKILAVVEFCVTESAGWEVVISLAEGILYFEMSSAFTSCFSSGTDMGVYPSL